MRASYINILTSKEALEGYLSLPPKEQTKVVKEAFILFAFIFIPIIGLILFGFYGPQEYFEIAIEIFALASIVGLFTGLYLVAKIRQKNDEDGSTIMFVVKFFVVLFSFSFLYVIHWMLDVIFAAFLVWLFYVCFKEDADYSKYTREVQGKFIGYKLKSAYFEHPAYCHSAYTSPVLIPVFEVKRKRIEDYSMYHDSAHIDTKLEKNDVKNQQAYLEAVDRFFDITHLEIGKTYTLKQHPIFRSKISYCMRFTQNRFHNSIDIYDDVLLKMLLEKKATRAGEV